MWYRREKIKAVHPQNFFTQQEEYGKIERKMKVKPRNKRKILRRSMAILLSLSLAIGMFSGIGVSAEETEETREEQEIQELWTPEEEAEEALNTAGDLSLEELATAELSEADIPEVVSAAEIEERRT